MGEYRGADPTIDLLNYLSERRSSPLYSLFYSDVDVKLDDIVENSSFHLHLDTEYERNYRRTYVKPASARDDLEFHESQTREEPVSPARPEVGNFVETEREYPREATRTIQACDFCNSGSLWCPNCEREQVVTCPSCHTHRGGDCGNQDCAGTGHVTCPECNGSLDCSNCSGRGNVECHNCRGSGNCPACSGAGTERCSACGGSGEVTRTSQEQCSHCRGSGRIGDDRCDTCGGSGTVTVERSETCQSCGGSGETRCPTCGGSGDCTTCGGDGRVVCDTCGGSGVCQTCNGDGVVTCPECKGTGVCQFCGGSGVKTCPTCSGNGEVLCPLCEGESQLMLYTSDVFVYEHTKDTEDVVPSPFGDQDVNPEGVSSIELDDLTAADVRSDLGLLNEHIRSTLEDAQATRDRILNRSEGREFGRQLEKSDADRQTNLRMHLEEIISTDWGRNPTDSYRADYKLELNQEERRADHDDLYRRGIFREWLFGLVPLSYTDLRVGEDRQRIHSVGGREDYELELPDLQPSPRKIGSLITGVLALMIAGATHPTAVSSPPMVPIVSVPASPVFAVIGGLVLALYAGIVYKDHRADQPTLLVIISDRDVLSTTFFAVLAHSVAYTEAGTIRDEIYTKLSQHLFDDLKLGTSLSYLIDFEDERSARVVSLSSSSAMRMSESVERLLERSDSIISVIGSNSDPQFWEQNLPHFEELTSPEIRVVASPDVATGGLDYPTYELDIEAIRERYLSGEEVEEDVIEPLVHAR